MPRLKKITKISSDWNNLKGVISVKFTEHSGWYTSNPAEVENSKRGLTRTRR